MNPACLDSIRAAAAAPRNVRGEMAVNPQPAGLYEAIRTTVHGERARAKVIADALGMSAHAVTDIADPLRRVHLKAYLVAGFVRSTNCFAILDYLEAEVGRVAFPLVRLDAPADEAQRALAREVKAFGDFLSETAQDMADGRIDQDELKRLLPAIDRVIARMCEFRETAVKLASEHAA